MKLVAGIGIGITLFTGDSLLPRPLPFLTQGTSFKYEITGKRPAAAIEHSDAVLKIAVVNRKGNNIASTGWLSYYNDKHEVHSVYVVRFACDSLNYYVHAANWCYESLTSTGEQAEYSGDSLCYPLNMHVNDSLPSAWAKSKRSTKSGVSTYSVEFNDRKVVAIDTVSAEFGMLPAFKITTNVTYSSRYDHHEFGKDKSKDMFVLTEWFIPSIGVVKTLYEGANFGTSRSEVISLGKE